ncbi:FecCD family ABC transporter permease [Pelagibacterium halotolerans]|uniref:Iron3+ dicitrate transport system permease protein n=1 Tax=Pelagibacterium halotolerans (strain DSM 22347 / JCM 15775 / CGMCC 1.7692 / B2) TaxID=1082931 RepID=G4R8B8_PELHB|nr:iron ABC transporter permease [Pelagibacterium halotolerans]AEQ52362.1 iron3+ dicitrate transport system permease protein [Pelagibacterium halotolerans B2]QJR17899.1 iron ABC transporter permease [Pelagibacterium halotolerans]SEA34326.1 iron complex transport system permease protein [Pelagibacterium halotolerans]
MSSVAHAPRSRRGALSASGLPVLLVTVMLLFGLHIAVGAKHLPLTTVLEAIFSRDTTIFDHMIVWDLRLPRALIALTVGAALAVAGALMQGVTRNPLADPGLLGLMAGASFAVVITSFLFGAASLYWLPWIAALGALVTALIVYFIAHWAPGGPTPLTLTLSGAAVSAFLGAIISIAHLLNEDTFDNLRVWLSGSLAGRDISMLYVTGPWIAVALAAGLVLARQVTALAMGDDVAKGLGVRTGPLKLQLLVVVVVLTACSVALAGPMGFVGLVIPHVARLFVGSDYRWIVPYSAVIGAAYLLGVDTIARIAIPPREISTGIITAMVGAPVFIQLVRMRAR